MGNPLLIVPVPTPVYPVAGDKRLLMFAYYFPPSSESGGQRPFRFAKHLLKAGYRTHVISATPQVHGSPWSDTTHVPSGIRGRLEAAIQRVAPYNDQLPWALHAIQAARTAIPEIRPVATISTFPPLGCHLASLSIKRRYGIPWIADFRDPLYENPFRTRWWAKPYDLAIERLILRQADAVIANTDAAADTLRRRYPQWSRKIHLIWNGYDPELALKAAPIPKRAFRILLHAGSVYGARHPNMLLASLERLFGQGRLNPSTIRIRLVGDLDADWVRTARSRFAGLHDTGCLEYNDQRVSQERAAREMAEADYLLLLDLNERGTGLQVPAKLFDYLSIGRPILAFTTPGSPTERILAKSAVPYVCIHPKLPEREVDDMVASFFTLPASPVKPSDWFQEQFDACAQTPALSAILEQLERCHLAT